MRGCEMRKNRSNVCNIYFRKDTVLRERESEKDIVKHVLYIIYIYTYIMINNKNLHRESQKPSDYHGHI